MINKTYAAFVSALMCAAGLSQAADDAHKGWEGVYGGINAVWGFDGKTKLKFPTDGGSDGAFGPAQGDVPRSLSHSPEGHGWGLHLGQNRQYGNWVVGLEGAFAWTDIDDSKRNAFIDITDGPTTHKTRLNSLATLTPRVGYAMGNWLPYVKAGLALGEIETSMTGRYGMAAVPTTFKRKHLHGGWTAGLGVEYALPEASMGAWVLGLEYNYTRFGSRRPGGQPVPDNTWAVQYDVSNPSFHTVMARLSYNFGGRAKSGSGGGASAAGKWAGLYGGVDGIWGFDGKSRMKFPTDGGSFTTFGPGPGQSPRSLSHSPDGNGWGLHLGQNSQYGNWVVGLEGSFAWTDIDDSKRNAFIDITTGPTTHKTRLNSLATLTPRVGYTMGNWLPYAKAGLALGEIETSMSGMAGPVPTTFKRKHLHNGWTAGLGVEYAMPAAATGAWIFGLEYNYYQLNTRRYGGLSVPDNDGWPVQYSVKPSFQTVGARVSYKF